MKTLFVINKKDIQKCIEIMPEINLELNEDGSPQTFAAKAMERMRWDDPGAGFTAPLSEGIRVSIPRIESRTALTKKIGHLTMVRGVKRV